MSRWWSRRMSLWLWIGRGVGCRRLLSLGFPVWFSSFPLKTGRRVWPIRLPGQGIRWVCLQLSRPTYASREMQEEEFWFSSVRRILSQFCSDNHINDRHFCLLIYRCLFLSHGQFRRLHNLQNLKVDRIGSSLWMDKSPAVSCIDWTPKTPKLFKRLIQHSSQIVRHLPKTKLVFFFLSKGEFQERNKQSTSLDFCLLLAQVPQPPLGSNENAETTEVPSVSRWSPGWPWNTWIASWSGGLERTKRPRLFFFSVVDWGGKESGAVSALKKQGNYACFISKKGRWTWILVCLCLIDFVIQFYVWIVAWFIMLPWWEAFNIFKSFCGETDAKPSSRLCLWRDAERSEKTLHVLAPPRFFRNQNWKTSSRCLYFNLFKL